MGCCAIFIATGHFSFYNYPIPTSVVVLEYESPPTTISESQQALRPRLKSAMRTSVVIAKNLLFTTCGFACGLTAVAIAAVVLLPILALFLLMRAVSACASRFL